MSACARNSTLNAPSQLTSLVLPRGVLFWLLMLLFLGVVLHHLLGLLLMALLHLLLFLLIPVFLGSLLMFLLLLLLHLEVFLVLLVDELLLLLLVFHIGTSVALSGRHLVRHQITGVGRHGALALRGPVGGGMIRRPRFLCRNYVMAAELRRA